MEEISHRQLRNESGEVLRRAAAGETILITNRGRPAAVIGPPPSDALSALSERGQLRPATESPAILRSIKRKRSKKSSAAILSDTRGKW